MALPEIPEGIRRPSSYIPEMEAWRGWAILLVLLSHWQGNLKSQAHQSFESSALWVKWIAAGNTGVTLFFVLSGFLLCAPFIKNLRGGPSVDLTAFYFSRILRIIPLYYAVVFFAWIVTGNGAAIQGLFFIPLGMKIFPYSAPWWSLSTEVQFYLLLPFVMLLLANKWGRLITITLLVVWIGVRIRHPGWSSDYSYFGISILGRLTAFLAGGALSWAYQTETAQRFLRSHILTNTVFFASGAALLTLMTYYGSDPTNAIKNFPAYHDLEAILWALVIFSSLGPVIFKKIFANRFTAHLGTISYSLYLVHLPIQFYLLYAFRLTHSQTGTLIVTGHWPELILRILASAVLCWLLAMLTYRYVETPFLKLKSRLPTRNTEPASASEASVQ